jgi:hypothetical protein
MKHILIERLLPCRADGCPGNILESEMIQNAFPFLTVDLHIWIDEVIERFVRLTMALPVQAGLLTADTRAVQVVSRQRRGGSYTIASCNRYQPLGGVSPGKQAHSLSAVNTGMRMIVLPVEPIIFQGVQS